VLFRLHHHAWYPAATVGNGLLTLSAYPIVASYFHRYQHNNSWYKIHQGDWWAGKGIGLARIELPFGGLLDFYNTHAQAGRGDTANAAVRYEQMGELADFLNASRTSTGIGLMVGDFNTRVGRPDFERAVGEAGLELMMTLDPGIDFILALQSPVYKYEALDTTVISGETQGSKAAIFLSRAPSPGELWRMLRGPGETTSLSDHSGYMSTIRISPTEFPEQ
jgi:sphingomyelin phosphodiesterase 2